MLLQLMVPPKKARRNMQEYVGALLLDTVCFLALYACTPNAAKFDPSA
jgi:hypothetical protein